MLSNLDIFGRIFIFTTFLPGLVGVGYILCLYHERIICQYKQFHSSSFIFSIVFLFVVFIIGFIANSIGHYVEVIYRKLRESTIEDPFTYYNMCLNTIGGEENKNILKSFEYTESLKAWYWNSMIILVVISVFNFFD